MTKTNDLGQPILFETPTNGNGYFEFAQFHGGDSRPYSLSGIDQSGKTTSYLGLFDQAEIRALAKAILNAMEPESLVENQKDPEPAYKPGDWVKVADDSPYNSSFRGQTLRLYGDQSNYPAKDPAVLLVSAEGYRGSVMKKYITPASAPEPAIVEQGYDVPALVASVADLEERVTALEAPPRMTDLAELRTFADYHRELADKADALILAMEADPKGTPALTKEPRTEIRVGDSVEYTGTESAYLVGARGVVSRIHTGARDDEDWITTRTGLLSGGAYRRNLTRI